MWESGDITATIDNRGAVVATLNRPDVSNAINAEMINSLIQLIDLCGSDPQIRVLCLTAAGNNFCSGADVRSAGKSALELISLVPQLVHKLAHAPVPVISLAHGACIGLGTAIIACSDIVLASPDAFFALSETRVGIAPLGVLPQLANAIGLRAAARYALTGERMAADQALTLGLVHKVVPKAELLSEALPFIDLLVRGGPAAMTETKAAIAEMREENFRPHEHDAAAFRSEDAREGTAAFIEKRSPDWYKPFDPGSEVPLGNPS